MYDSPSIKNKKKSFCWCLGKTFLNSPCPECLCGEFVFWIFQMSSNLPCSRAKNWFHSPAAREIGADLGIHERAKLRCGQNQGGWQCDTAVFSPLYNEFKLETRFGSEITYHGSISGPPHLLWIKQDGLGGKVSWISAKTY